MFLPLFPQPWVLCFHWAQGHFLSLWHPGQATVGLPITCDSHHVGGCPLSFHLIGIYPWSPVNLLIIPSTSFMSYLYVFAHVRKIVPLSLFTDSNN